MRLQKEGEREREKKNEENKAKKDKMMGRKE